MACIPKPESNFLYGYFRCLLPLETVDIEVKVKTMRGIHTFRRDRTTQVLSCNPWSTRLHPYPSLIRKMKMYLELEGKLGPQPQWQPCTSTPSHDRNPSTRKTMVSKKMERKRRAKAPVNRRFKVRVIAQPMPSNPTSTVNPIPPAEPNPTVATLTATTQMPVAKSAVTSIPVTVYNLAKGKFEGIPYPTGRPPVKENPSAPSHNTPQPRQQPEAAAPQNREDTPWPNIMPASTNLFDVRTSWPIPSTETPIVVRIEKTEVPPRVAAIPHMMINKPPQDKTEKCGWGLHCAICAKEEDTEDWNGKRQLNQQRNHYPQSP